MNTASPADPLFLGPYCTCTNCLDWIDLLGPMRESHVVTVAALHLKVCVVNTALQIREEPASQFMNVDLDTRDV